MEFVEVFHGEARSNRTPLQARFAQAVPDGFRFVTERFYQRHKSTVGWLTVSNNSFEGQESSTVSSVTGGSPVVPNSIESKAVYSQSVCTCVI